MEVIIMKKNSLRILAALLGIVMCFSCLPLMSACDNGGSKEKTSIVIMTDELSGLFNPFYATSGADMDVVGMTQIGMLSTDEAGKPRAGDEYATVAKAFNDKDVTYDENNNPVQTVYTFVVKNNLKFSDGKPLTMNDVFFNMYEYLDPVYTGSSTMYSIDIKGLAEYRLQSLSSNLENAEDEYTRTAIAYGRLRRMELVTLYETEGLIEGSQNSYSLTPNQMYEKIATWDVSDGYKDAVASEADQATMTDDDYRALLKKDYDYTLETFKKELESDFKAAKESYDLTAEPYAEWADVLKSDIFKFFLYEQYIKPEYRDNMGRKDKTKIEKFSGDGIVKNYTTEEAAINKVYNDKIVSELNNVLAGWGTADTVLTKYTAEAKSILLYGNITEANTMKVENISGIVSLGHTTDVQTVTINGIEYKVAHEHNADGTPKNSDEYDVLQITINGVDPKAVYSFGFTVAPAHYYSADAEYPNGRPIDIAGNKFGVPWNSPGFQDDVIQSRQHVEVPVGAGAFMATDRNDSDSPAGTGFSNNNIVYYKANRNFMFDVKTERIRMQVVSSSDSIDALARGDVDYITPQFTIANSERLTSMHNSGFEQLSAWQLGYGYIGINAGKVKNINVRRAIMCAMQTSLALEFYATGTCKNIDWPMSTESWAYPFESDGKTSKPNGHDYTQWTTLENAKEKIRNYMREAGVSGGDSQLKITFTIAGSSITEHPTYVVFKQAREILNEMGWEIEVKADSQALTKLSTGSLAVWAAAWGSTVDPDMYQVYHKNSTATSVYSWGYREIKAEPNKYKEETAIINQLSDLIDDGRATLSQKEREGIYESAMKYVLDLAVELPVYQRMTLYAYNSKTVKGFNESVNPYSSPLEKIWELELVK